MNVKIMEGLVGAGNNGNLLNTPMWVYREAKRKGDAATMDRAMGYACEFAGKAEEYRQKAEEGIEEDIEKAREKVKAERKEALQKSVEECRKEKPKEEKAAKEKGEESQNTDADADKEPVGYTKTGEAVRTKPDADISISV